MDKKKKGWIGIVCLVAVVAFGVGYTAKQGTTPEEMAESSAAVSESKGHTPAEAQSYTVSQEEAQAAATVITLAQDGTTVQGSGVSVQGNIVSIQSGGVYRLTGTLTDGQIYVEVGGKESVALVLDGVSIANETETAIYVENAGAMALYLMEGTENTVSSGTAIAIDADAVDASASGGAVYLRDDTAICGGGSLTVYGYLNNGIHCTNTLFVEDGVITVTAANHGIKGKDSLVIDGGTVTVLSGGDGLTSDDETGEGYGIIGIHGGEITVESWGDAISAETALSVSGGTLTLKTYGDAFAQTVEAFGWGRSDANWDMDSGADSSDLSTKGLKSGGSLTITGGTFTIDTVDDAIHCDGVMEISGGSFILSSGDDGIHADTSLVIGEADITILTSYEGIESNQITINSGTISLYATDDGMNACGGSSGIGEGFQPGGFPGGDGSGDNSADGSNMVLPTLTINGGDIYVNASGDGLDSNGNLIINGGTVIIDGPSSGADGALDYGSENGGSMVVNGGTVLALGASGMAEAFGGGSEQCSFAYTLSTGYGAGSTIAVTEADGTVLCSYSTAKSGNSIIFSDPALTVGDAYILSVDGVEYEITLTDTVTSGGAAGGFGGGAGGMQGGRQDMPSDGFGRGGQDMPSGDFGGEMPDMSAGEFGGEAGKGPGGMKGGMDAGRNG